MTRIHDPGQDRLIDELYVWVSVDPKTNLEGLCGVVAPNGMSFPAISSSRALASKMKFMVLAGRQKTGKKFKLLRFATPEIVEVVG